MEPGVLYGFAGGQLSAASLFPAAMVERNGWQDVYMQGLVDEPQLYNSMSYRALTGLFRREFPGIKIIDPVETLDIYGSCDIWVIKQAIYEMYREEYNDLMLLIHGNQLIMPYMHNVTQDQLLIKQRWK